MNGPIRHLFFIACLWVGSVAVAADLPATQTKGAFMNGLAWKDYAGFWDKEKLVTVRFREDNGELRFIYANAVAWDAIQQGAATFPDGSVFMKAAVKTARDPLFDNSAVPSGASRYQIMVKDSKRYPATAGWGYAIFSQMGTSFVEDETKAVEACHACHTLAAQRDYVFARAAALGTRRPLAPPALGPDIAFRTTEATAYPAIAKAIGNSSRLIRVLEQSALKQHNFAGTIDELVPLLLRELRVSGVPAAFVDGQAGAYAVAYHGDAAACRHGDEAVTMSIPPWLMQTTRCVPRPSSVPAASAGKD
jgi:hypothetical protein